MTLDEWRDELQRLSVRPGSQVALIYWRKQQQQLQSRSHRRHRECNRAVRMMKPLQRAEYNEGHSLGRNAQALRTGRNSWLVLSPNIGELDPMRFVRR